MAKSKISWTDYVWNPTSGCTKISPGCANCYAEAFTLRFGLGGPFVEGKSAIKLHEGRLDITKRWPESSLVFVDSMSDLFHPSLPLSDIVRVLDVIEATPQYIFQVLTKRADYMEHVISHWLSEGGYAPPRQPPPNLWLGVSVENMHWAALRLQDLRDTPAAVRFVSVEPMLGPVDLAPWLDWLDWVIDGGESGPGRRPADYDWFRHLRDQCVKAGVPYFHKQGNHRYPGRDLELDGIVWDQFPAARGKTLSDESRIRGNRAFV